MENLVYDDILMHYGTKRHSGRYPWGSGENPFQHSGDFLSRVEELEKGGMSQKEVAEALGLSTTEFRLQKSLAKDERRAANVATAKAMRGDGYSLREIAAKMGFKNDSSVRTLLNEDTENRKKAAQATADILKKEVEKKA